MTVVQISNSQLIGVAADTKPTTYPAGTRFFETDTGNQFYYNGTTWVTMSGGGGGAAPSPAKIIVYFDSPNWIAKSDTGTQLTSNTSATTVLQYALNNLTAARTYKETIKVNGNLTISKITIPSYTVLDLTGARLFQADSTNTNMIENSDTTTGNTEIEIIGGEIDGNRAGQTGGGGAETTSLLWFKKCSNVNIHDGFWTHANYHCLRFLECPTNIRVTNNRIENWKQEGVCDHANSIANGLCYGHIIANNYFSHTEPGYSAAAVGSCAISTWNVNDVVFANNVVENIMAGSMTTFNGLRQIVIGNTIRNGAGGVGVIGLGTTSAGITMAQVAASTADCSGSIISGNRISNLGRAGIHVQNPQESKDIIISNNMIDGVKDATANGLLVQDVDNCIITGNVIFDIAAAGIVVNGNTGKGGALNCTVSDNICYNTGTTLQSQDYRRAGIAIYTTNAGLVNNILVHGNRCYDNQGTKTQKYGIMFLSTTDCIAKDNDVRGNLTAGILSTTNTGLITSSNTGYDTDTDATPNRSLGYYFIKGTNATMQNRRYTPSITAGPNAASTTSPTANTLFALPFVVSRSTQFDLISFRVTTLGSGNARAGIYLDNGNTYPGALMFDTGSISTSAGSTSAARDTTITSGLQTFAPGLYWLVWETDSATGQYNAYNGAVLQSSAILGHDAGMGTAAPAYGYSVAHTFGTLPDPYTANAVFLSTAPVLTNPIVVVGLRPI